MADILYIDPIAGASGDMFLGALVDLGVSFEKLEAALASMNVSGFALRRSETKRHTIAATKVDVIVADEPHPHRHLRDLLRIVDAAPLDHDVKHMAEHALERLAHAESHVHRMPVERVHLHEVGGLDCLVDIVGTVWALHELCVDRILSGPVSVGSGFVRCAHGTMPTPAPGTLEILGDFPIRRTQFPFEMTTPTGAAILATMAQPITGPIVMTPRKVGYGAGSRDPHEVANMLRVVRADVGARLLPPAVEHHHDHHDHGHDHSHDHDHDHDHGHHHHHHHDEPTAPEPRDPAHVGR